MEVDHIIPRACGGKDAYHNWQLLHRHCHDRKTAEDRTAVGTKDSRQMIEEPCDAKVSSTVLKPSGGSDPVA
jgi:RNA-directed DNA polymerase